MRYFQHDTNSKANRKLRKVIRTHGTTGYAIWWAILEELYNSDSTGFVIHADELWLENLAEALCISDYRTLIRVFDTFAEVNLISPQLWADHHLHVPSIVERGDEYTRKKALNAKRQSRFREKSKPQKEGEKCVSNASRNAESNDVTLSEAYTDPKIRSKDQIQRSDPKIRSKDQDPIEEPAILNSQNFDRVSFENSNVLESQEEFPDEEIRDESTTPLKRASIEGKTEIYGMGPKSSGGALTGRSGPNPETFDSWWKTYRKMCLMINAQAGKRKEAWEEWQKNYETYESPHFEECDRLYREWCGQQMMQRGNVYGVAHGCRYLRGPLWQDAFDRAELLANSPVDFTSPKAVKQLGQRFEQQKINNEVRELLAKREAQNDIRHF